MRARLRSRTDGSKLENRFLRFWSLLGGPELEREYQFNPGRRWRADFAHVQSRVLIEVEGGIYAPGGGRHNRAPGFVKDCEKYLEATLGGWRVVRLTSSQITAPTVERLIAWVGTDSPPKV